MKYAFMSFSCPDLNFDDMLALAKRIGYDAIEPRAGSSHGHGVERNANGDARTAFKAAASKARVAISCLAVSCRYADPETFNAQVSETHEYIDLASDIGTRNIRVFGGQIPEGVSREAAIDQVVLALKSLADHAAERGVTICMETHDDWCDPAHVATVMRKVNHPAIAVNWDIWHPVRRGGATMDTAYMALKPWIRYVHFHDGVAKPDELTMLPIGEGDIDHKRALELLITGGYSGYLSGEWINWEPYEVHLPRELAAMKAYEAEIGG